MGTLVSTIYIHYALRKAPCLKQILLGNLIALSIRESYYSTISSVLGALVITSAPVERMIITSSMRTPNLPGR